MITPKDFYRKLDSLIEDIYKIEGIDMLPAVLSELVNFLGKDISISGGFLYEMDGDHYELIHATEQDAAKVPYLSVADDVVRLTLEHSCYIFNETNDLSHSAFCCQWDQVPAAFSVILEDKRWIFIFLLKPGWQREEIELSLNIVSKILNSRYSNRHFQNYIHQAELIQRSLLPKEFPKIEGFDIAGKSIPAEVVGGDLFDILTFDEDYFGIAIGDASGHGLPAALVVRDVVTGLRMGMEKHMKMTHTLNKLNNVIHRSRLSTSFVSLFYAEIETNGNMIYVNAGHPSPLRLKGDTVEEFPVGGLVLGPMPHVELKRGFKELVAGDAILLFTDGLIERINSNGEPYEVERLVNSVKKIIDRPASEIVEKILHEVYQFGNSTNWLDDVTFIVIKKLVKSIFQNESDS